MRRRGLLVMLGVATLIIGSVAAAPRISSERTDASACRLSSRNPSMLTHGTVRDRDSHSHAQVANLLGDLRHTLLGRFGESDERRLGNRLPSTVIVPVRFHVLAWDDQGRMSRAAVDQQIAALNAAYSGRIGGADTGVSFRLIDFDVTNNADWFADPRRYEGPLKAALRRGGPGTLNLYSAAVGRAVLGISTFPQWYRERPVLDGVMIDYRSMPGGVYPHFNRGYTAVHEVGHWLGLLHTFENGCDSPGDAVDDTPYEALPTEGCPWSKNTCWLPGDDPRHNFMDYGFDVCMREFTAGQGLRIRLVWAAYRAHGAGSVLAG